jgi:phosphate transport system protein
MFNKAMTAFFISDYLSALELYKMNKIINSSCALLVEKYLSYAEKNTSDIRVCMHMISILNQAERIGDRSVNIAGSLYFIVKGNEYTQNK